MVVRSAALAALAALTAFAPAHAQTARPLGDARLEAIAGRYFADLWRLDPTRATQVGVHDYDDRLGSFTAEAYAERLNVAKRYLAEVRAIEPTAFGAEGSYDARILANALEATIAQIGTRQAWKHEPAAYAQLASGAIYGLISRDFAPLPARMRLAIARERAIPALLEAAAQNVTTVDATTAQIARTNIVGTVGFFTNVVPVAFAPVKDAALQADLKNANDAALGAVRTYLAVLDRGPFAHPAGTFAIGAAEFAQRLRLQETVPISLAEYERVGEAALAKTKSEFIATAKAIDPAASPAEVARALGASHPAEGELIPKAAADLAALRAFVVAHHIVTLPPDDNVRVIATPQFARATTFASMNSPGSLETSASEAYYNVTPVEPEWTPARKEQHLSFFNNYYFPLVSAHEVMPGHYVNFALARHEKLSLVRRLLSSPSFAEGWAHYDEQMLVDEGWGGGDPHVRLAQLQGALLRECRYLVGLREHTAGMTVDAATSFFEANAFVAHEPAHREALRGTADPLYGYYTLGKLELLKLRDDYKRVAGSRYSLQAFHDALLAHGDPPMAIVRKIMLGAEDDGKLL
ncbi:MAG: DUF885 domain-containing protein [Vulcanimicrobiaceae bacterium]